MTRTPIIPQTRQQALERDSQAGLIGPMSVPADRQLVVLQNAIRQHQTTIETAGELEGRHTATNRKIMDAKHEADQILWAHLDTGGTNQ